MFGVTGSKKGAGRLRQGEIARMFTADELGGAVAVGLGRELVVILGPGGDIVEQVGQVRQVPIRNLKSGETVLIASAITITINFLLGNGKAPKREKAFQIDDAVMDAKGNIVNGRVRVGFKVDTSKFKELGRRTQQKDDLILRIEDVQSDISAFLVHDLLAPAFKDGVESFNGRKDTTYWSNFDKALSNMGFSALSVIPSETKIAPDGRRPTVHDAIKLGRTRWLWFDALRVIAVLLSIASSTTALLFWTGVLPPKDTPPPPPPPVVLTQHPSIQLSIADETVRTGEETNVTIVLVNPRVNDDSIEGEMRLRIGGGTIRLDASGEDASGIVAVSFEPPIKPGEARTFRFKASAARVGNYPLTGNVQYWPEGYKSGAASLSVNGSVSVVN